MTDTFCPAPWISMFYQVNTAKTCCVGQDSLKMSPEEFLSSDYLKNIKQQFLNGEKPKNCSNCWRNEDNGFQSIREHYINNFPEYSKEDFTDINARNLEYVELRCSNLCNYKCRMCNGQNSVEIAREHDKNIDVEEISEDNWNQLLQLTDHLKYLFLTGGEPMIMKQYYELMDKLVENGKSKDLSLNIYTNCSVYNPKIIEKIKQFKTVNLNMSIDAVGKVAEYQRKGTDWNTVLDNINKFSEIENVTPKIHSTITAYAALDIDKLVDFYVDIKNKFPKMRFMMHIANYPIALAPTSLNLEMRLRVQDKIQKSVNKMQHPHFKNIQKIMLSLFKTLETAPILDFEKLLQITRVYDKVRNESFKEVYGFDLTL